MRRNRAKGRNPKRSAAAREAMSKIQQYRHEHCPLLTQKDINRVLQRVMKYHGGLPAARILELVLPELDRAQQRRMEISGGSLQ